MDTRAIVTFNKEKAKNSEEARGYAYDFLENNGFASSERFAPGVANWFVIGGRWSGCLLGDAPIDRDQYMDIGYEDDALIITEDIYDKWIEELDGQVDNGGTFWDLDYDLVSKELIGNKWIVVIDYHN